MVKKQTNNNRALRGGLMSRLLVCVLAAGPACNQRAVEHHEGPEDASRARPALEYTLSVPAQPRDSLHVTVKLNDWTGGDSVRFILPPVYADNPFLTARGNNVYNLAVYDQNQLPIIGARDSIRVGAYWSRTIAFAAPLAPVRMEYDVTLHYLPDAAYIPVPRARPDGVFLEGNYLFAVPWRERNPVLTGVWRDPFDIQLHYAVSAGMEIYGDPPGVRFKNAYELMFSQSLINGQVLIEESGRHQLFRVVDIRSASPVPPALLPGVRNAGVTLLTDITALFGTLGAPLTMILGTDPGGGFEGMYAFSLLDPWAADSGGVFNMVLAHEAIHAWVGVRCGEYDDPWWKEGTTNYLGLLVARRNGLCHPALVEGTLLADIGETLAVRTIPLAAASVREDLFRAPGMSTLVYTKGAQVCMLLDSRIRKESNNMQSLDKIVAELCKWYDGRAFHRAEYLALIQSMSGVDVSEIFKLYVDLPGSIPQAVLQNAYRDLAARGAWGSLPAAKGAVTQRMPGVVRDLWNGKY